MTALNKSTRILIVDDDEDDFFITSEYVRNIPGMNYEMEWAGTYKAGLESILAHRHDLYFVDYRLGARSGVDLLKEAKAAGSDAPIVLLTGQGNYSVDIEAMKLGAVDYLIKAELSTEKMERCIRYAMERTEATRALKRSEAKFRSIFEQSKDIIFIADGNLTIKEANSAFGDLLGISQARGINLTDLLCDDEDKATLKDLVEKKQDIRDLATTIYAADGSKVHCTITLSAEQVSGKGETSIQGIIHDITNLKRAEIATLQTEKLAAAGRLVRTLAHEVRNPLNNIAMSAEYFAEKEMSEDEHLYLDIIKRNIGRINTLINELLQSSTPRDNTLKPHTLQIIADEVLAAAMDRVTLKKMKAKVNYHADPVVILADFENLKLALLNIVINAIEAMAENEGLLDISITQNGDAAQLTIADNGIGIAEENIARIFEPYYTRKRTGAGLGLSFSLNIIKAHGATIDVKSKQGVGTTFVITFPPAEAEA